MIGYDYLLNSLPNDNILGWSKFKEFADATTNHCSKV